jgi:hypothetical protein
MKGIGFVICQFLTQGRKGAEKISWKILAAPHPRGSITNIDIVLHPGLDEADTLREKIFLRIF